VHQRGHHYTGGQQQAGTHQDAPRPLTISIPQNRVEQIAFEPRPHQDYDCAKTPYLGPQKG
jgi:hypothetical protein